MSWARCVLALLLASTVVACANRPTETILADDDLTPAAALKRLFAGSQVDAAWFAPSFLESVGVEQIRALRDDYLAIHGPMKSVHLDENFWLLKFDAATVPSFAALDESGRFVVLWFNPVEPASAPDLPQTEALLAQYEGDIAVLLERDGEVLFEQAADRPLAVGSAFKLSVLQALVSTLATGSNGEDIELPLLAEHKSLPSGRLQMERTGSRWSIEVLAEKMIAESDNTATDMLLSYVGRDTLEAISPRNAPFLSTGEAFRLKNPKNAATLAAWRAADVDARRALLGTVAALPLPDVSLFKRGPVALDIEWFYSPREICRTLNALQFHPATLIQTAQIDATRWRRVAYKGGSEGGVINQSFLLEDDFGRVSCVSATWNREDGLIAIPFYRLVSHFVRLARELD